MIEMREAIRSIPNEKEVQPDSLSANLLKVDDPVILQHLQGILHRGVKGRRDATAVEGCNDESARQEERSFRPQ